MLIQFWARVIRILDMFQNDKKYKNLEIIFGSFWPLRCMQPVYCAMAKGAAAGCLKGNLLQVERSWSRFSNGQTTQTGRNALHKLAGNNNSTNRLLHTTTTRTTTLVPRKRWGKGISLSALYSFPSRYLLPFSSVKDWIKLMKVNMNVKRKGQILFWWIFMTWMKIIHTHCLMCRTSFGGNTSPSLASSLLIQAALTFSHTINLRRKSNTVMRDRSFTELWIRSSFEIFTEKAPKQICRANTIGTFQDHLLIVGYKVQI